jgi:GNAT superfamily N-acetyltransferase
MSIETIEKTEIIEATENDIPEILGFTDIFLRRDWIINRGYCLSNLKNGIILLAKHGRDKIVGVAVAKKNRTLYLLYVHPKYRSQKIGYKILQRLNPETIRARINQTTGNPVPYYERLGYKISIPHDPKNRNICIMKKE